MCAKKKKKKKKLRLLLLSVACILLLACLYVYARTPAVYIGDMRVNFTPLSGLPFTDKQGRVQVPLRAAMEAYGCEIQWEEAQKTAILEKDGIIVQVPVGEQYILVDGVKKATDTATMLRSGHTYLPIRPVLEAFGSTVRWDAEKNAVFIIHSTTGELQVHFIDVGQADAILIDNQTFEVLIDAGNNKDGAAVAAYLADYVDGALDVVIATHPDADHIGGLDDVLQAFDVSKIIDSGAAKDTKTYKEYWQAAQNEANCEIVYDADMLLDIGGGGMLEIIETGDDYKDANDNSVVAKLTYGNVSVLLTGDMEKEAETTNLSRFGKVTVLKAGHHGSATSSSQALLDILQPEYVIISAGRDNSYNHPHQKVLQRYFNSNATVYGTFRSGTIIMSTDGTTVSFNTNDPVVLSDAGDYAA